MIVNFSVQNFGSIKQLQTLSFEADAAAHLEESYTVQVGKLRLLKLALIYGANASGKTTLLTALDFLRKLVLEPAHKKTDELDFNPFLFDKKTPHQNTVLSLSFIHQEIKYSYEVVFFKKAIVSEELNFYNPNKANLYKRTTSLANQFTAISFGSKIAKDKALEKSLEANTLWNNTVLGGFLKTNINFKELQVVIDWFKEYLKPMVSTRTALEELVTTAIRENAIAKEAVVRILKQADFNITDIIIDEQEEQLSAGLLAFLKNQVKEPDATFKKLEERGKVTSVNIEFEHSINKAKYTLPLALESEGTKRYYGLAGLLALLIATPTVFAIDELEASLHPDLYLHFLLSFVLNAKHSQLIATTHNRELLDNKAVFRNDVIWFTDKKNDAATVLYSLADFDSAVIRNTTNILNAYKAGRLNGTPNLGDTYIDT